MCTKNQLLAITNDIALKAKEIFCDKLDCVILYGSYARGDATAQSDIDMMILADLPIEEINANKRIFTNLSSELGLANDVVVTVTLKDSQTFYRYVNDMPFYNNIKREGVQIAV